MERLLGYFGTEMNILHRVNKDELTSVVGGGLAHIIELSRIGELIFKRVGAVHTAK